MADGFSASARHQELIDVIHRVRNRWRMRLALRGVVVVVAGTLLALLLSASSLEALRFSPGAITSFRLAAFIVFAGLTWIGLVRPLMRRVTDSQVAMYLEESDPTLQTALLSAVESSGAAGTDPNGPSPRLIERIVEQAIDKCRALEDGNLVERKNLRRQLVTLGTVAAAAAIIISLGPAFLRQGLSALLIISRSAEAASPYKIEVTPGNTKIPRGTDQPIAAKLQGFQFGEAALMMRSPGGEYQRVGLNAASEPGTFEGVLFHVDKQTEYYVESNGVTSPVYTMDVVDLPTVDHLVLEYRFPEYTDLAPRTIDPGGDIAALQGTEVAVRVTPTMATPGGRILLNENESVALTRQPDGTLAGTFKVTAQGFYRIELEGPQAEKVNASPKYTIDVLTDLPPSVAFAKPGRDTSATPVEEVLAEVRADDDYGVKSMQMFYSVNGGPEKTIRLFGGSRTLPEVTATHTIYLEELGLKAGDFVSYYAKASDNDGVAGAKTTTSDIYFVEIRPFRRDYKPATSGAAGMAGGGGGGQEVGQLSRQQREIVSATFNIVRDRAKMSAEKFRENAVFLTLAQARLREQVQELSEKMNSRLDVVDPAFKTIAEALPKAAEEMKLAEAELKGLRAKDALSPEQKALKLLQDAEQNYEMQVAASQNGGGGGGGSSQMAEDLADLFELEMDKLANQYEMQQRAEQQSEDRKVDELVEKLKELARRQQQEAERQRRLAASGQQNSNGGGSELQRQLAKEVEEAARQLQQLSRDQQQQRQGLNDALRQLQDAANAMKQAAANGQDGGAQAQAALERLREAQRRLQNNQGGRGQRDVEQAIKQADELAREAREVEKEVQGLEGQSPTTRPGKVQQLGQRKDSMDQRVADLQDQLEKLANGARGENRDAARKLDEAAGSITDKRIREMIRYSKNAMQGNPSEYARGVESQIGANLEGLKKKIEDAAAAFGDGEKRDAMDRAMDKARDLVRGMESLDQRMRDRARQAQQGQGKDGEQARNGQQQGQEGQQGKQGQEGQQGQQGQEGQQGQQGQQGQGQGQGQGQNAQGQQGGQPGGEGQQAATQPGYATGQAGSRDGGGYGYGDARYWNGRYSPDDWRQYRNELRQWEGEAQALRRELMEAGMDARELDQVLRDMRQLASEQNFVTGQNLQSLQAAALDKLKRFEFNLRRKSEEKNGDKLALSGSDEVPAGFRTAIEEYYRSLARKR
ncbi:MAG: DUF4175 family protein [Vicinamibacterales bacterium]